jgi:hypothetical protein
MCRLQLMGDGTQHFATVLAFGAVTDEESGARPWLTDSKYDRMSASRIKFTFLVVIPTTRASSASCCPRFGRNPYENPRKPSS